MNPPSKDIVDIIQNNLSYTEGTDLFIGREPAEPDNTATVFDVPGGPAGTDLSGANENYSPVIQIRVRNRSYLDGWSEIDDIKNVLHGLGPIEQGGATYHSIKCTMEPALLDYDENGRARFVTTFNLERK